MSPDLWRLCLCSSLPVPTQWFLQASICILHWQWVFPAILLGTRLYSPHKSKDTIKATHQRAIKGTTHIAMERMLLNRQFLQTFSPHCCSKCRRDVPDACLCNPLSLAHLKTPGSAHRMFCLPQGPGPQTPVLPLVLCGLCIVPRLLFLKTRGIDSCLPTR